MAWKFQGLSYKCIASTRLDVCQVFLIILEKKVARIFASNIEGGVYLILEAVFIQVEKGKEMEFEEAFRGASRIISSIKGYINHELQRCLEVEGKYLLLVKWKTLEDHTVGFRQSREYQEWRKQLHHL